MRELYGDKGAPTRAEIEAARRIEIEERPSEYQRGVRAAMDILCTQQDQPIVTIYGMMADLLPDMPKGDI
jgi:hypothetical protein